MAEESVPSDGPGCDTGRRVSMLTKLGVENGHRSGLPPYVLWESRVLHVTASSICGNESQPSKWGGETLGFSASAQNNRHTVLVFYSFFNIWITLLCLYVINISSFLWDYVFKQGIWWLQWRVPRLWWNWVGRNRISTGVIEVNKEALIEWGLQYDLQNDEFQIEIRIGRILIWHVCLGPWI